jgi:hypothetical protein
MLEQVASEQVASEQVAAEFAVGQDPGLTAETVE